MEKRLREATLAGGLFKVLEQRVRMEAYTDDISNAARSLNERINDIVREYGLLDTGKVLSDILNELEIECDK